MKFLEPLLVPYKKYAVLNGRASRKEYWLFILYFSIVVLIFRSIDGFLGTFNEDIGLGYLTGILYLGSIIPGYANGIRRLHDINKSGWWILLSLIPIANIWLLVLFCKKGDLEDNRFGKSPYSVDNH